jgi:transcription elongation GreA/GreB family factor
LSTTSEYYIARADENARDAENTKLDNVRDRCRRSEAAWRLMADRVVRGEVMRDSIAAEKATRAEMAE